jgi:hypothetical protein
LGNIVACALGVNCWVLAWVLSSYMRSVEPAGEFPALTVPRPFLKTDLRFLYLLYMLVELASMLHPR